MKLQILYDRLAMMPMIKVLVPLIVGIAVMRVGELPLWFVAGAMTLFGAYSLWAKSSVGLVLTLFLFGASVSTFDRVRRSSPRFDEPITAHIEVESSPVIHKKWQRADARLLVWSLKGDGDWIRSGENIQLWVDTTQRIEVGERVVVRGIVREISDDGGSFSELMYSRGVVGSMFVFEGGVSERSLPNGRSLHEWAIEKFGRLDLGTERRGVAAAMSIGDRSDIDPSLRAEYARAGASHLLAVSGLHVGVVFVLVNLLLGWLSIFRYGHIVRNALVILVVWLYALIAGASPSVLRAAIMFSALQFSLASTRQYVGMNTLAATAFVMLSLYPRYLFDISFQLSFIAVGAIIAWGVPVYRELGLRLQFRSKILRGVVGLVVMGVVVNVATAPLVAYNFGVVSLIGVLLGPLLVLLAHAIIFVGVVWLVMPSWMAPEAFEWVLNLVVGFQNWIVQMGASLSHGAVEWQASKGVVVAVYGVYIALTLVLWSVERKRIYKLKK